MADYLTTDTELTSVASAIRTKGGTSAALTFPAGFVSAINAIPTGASNFIEGTFTTGSTAGAGTITLPYTGEGYPIGLFVCVDGGAYKTGTTWYDSLQRYAIGLYAMTKADFSSAPTYTTSGTNNQGCVWVVFKNSTSSATSYSRNSSMTVNAYGSSNASNSVTTTFRFKSATTLSYYVNTSSYGLLPNTTYRYFVIYSA